MGRAKVQKHRATREEMVIPEGSTFVEPAADPVVEVEETVEVTETLDVTELPSTVETPDDSQLGTEKDGEIDIKVTEVPAPTAIQKEDVHILTPTTFEYNGEIYSYASKSKMFVELHLRGYTVGEIAKETQSHYSFVYGVIDKHVGVTRQPKNSKADIIRTLAIRGMTPGQIAKELNSNYSYVHSVVKKFKDMGGVADA